MYEAKASYRDQFLAARQGMERSAVEEFSRRAAQHIIRSPMFRAAEAVLLYSPIENEMETDALRVAAEADGKSVYYVRVASGPRTLEFVRVSPGEVLRKGRLGIPEPTGDETFQAGNTALVVVPGVAFDRSGTRLGRGGGYYDRALRKLRSTSTVLGMAYTLQLARVLPRDAHDEPVGFIGTETEVFCCAANSTYPSPVPPSRSD